MKRALIIGTALISLVAIQALAQCKKTHFFCTNVLDEDQQKEFWNLNNQSQSANFKKGEVYKMSFIAYKGFDYRISVCTDIEEGGDKIRFELAHDAVVRVKDEYGNTNIKRQRESLYKNNDDNLAQYLIFTVEKTEKFYLDVNIPASGESSDKKLAKTDNVCVGVLLEHKKVEKFGF
ncbi:hypothetical protein K6119_19380 [Paracrocinitomix mangrovi]|uniref:hypothetical protein n=1 Tax=Paracrocinitomix mangrovi TaxID=2862509 RepID=UPI001C8ED3B6|nr:hypothetical protein [Paracrocinitomix mangrovi]UKN01889.1 hypothetical protein K6119_19380 [Paracrocinitomix mangrovi]